MDLKLLNELMTYDSVCSVSYFSSLKSSFNIFNFRLRLVVQERGGWKYHINNKKKDCFISCLRFQIYSGVT